MNNLTVEEIGNLAKIASLEVKNLTSLEKNDILIKCANKMVELGDNIINSNKIDIENARKNNIKETLIDRLMLNTERIENIANGLKTVVSLPDPIGEGLSQKTLPNGLTVSQIRVPMGVVGMIYEARPNVTADAFGLVFKAGSSLILRGGKEAINSNIAIVNIFRSVLSENNYNENIVQLITDTSRDSATALMKLNKYLDILIPRGGQSLINSVVENSTVPVIETGVGNCHIYVDLNADLNKAMDIIINAKTQRPSVCNACEKVILHSNIAKEFLPKLISSLKEYNVEIRGDLKAVSLSTDVVLASDSEWYEEYLDLIIGIKIVDNLDEAIAHISEYSSKHSDCIISENYSNVQKFLNEVDSAAVYANASTRFTDGFEFGFGAEIGISTQKLHARGPMGLTALTTTKFVIMGNGQIRK